MLKSFRLSRLLGAALAALFSASCAGDSVAPATNAPAAPNSIILLDKLFPVNVLQRVTALPADITVAKVIGSSGGTLEIPAAGFRLVVPKDAVKSDTRFSVTAIKGKMAAYEFEPHGTKFGVSLRAQQSLSGTDCNLVRSLLLKGAYFQDRSLLQNTTALVTELISGLFTPLTNTFSFPIDHFSGYVVAW